MRMKRWSTLLIVVGILIMSVPLIGHVYTDYKQEQLYEQYLMDLGQTDLTDPDADKDTEIKTEPITSEAAVEAPKAPKVENVIGTLAIPSIKCNQLLLEGSTSKELKYGVGHITGTAEPGAQGNFAVAGHRNYTFGTYFNRLDEVKNGDIITVTYQNNAYDYEIYDSFIVLPSEISVLSDIENESIITLVTCHPKGSNTQRLIVRGKLL